ncbi:MAG TPA: hypothetical protein DDW54_04625 [Clostridiales bacterium]|nr:hypothetical protein [Clostridiales bacterium]
MKKFFKPKRIAAAFLSLFFAASLAACADLEKSGITEKNYGYVGGAADCGDVDTAFGVETDGGYVYRETSGDTASAVEREYERQAGLITASGWNDNDHYAEYVSLLKREDNVEQAGKFAGITAAGGWGLITSDRVKVSVKKDGLPVAGAKAVAKDDDGNVLFTAKTLADGTAYLFPAREKGKITVSGGGAEISADFDGKNRETEINLTAADQKVNRIKLMLVVDVTGSMGDELRYLKTELGDVVKRVSARDENTEIDLALLFYRDDGDYEKFAFYDFVNANDGQAMDAQLKNLAKQVASGGGDYPEAVDEALDIAVKSGWGDDTSTKLIFHVLDAPPHSNGDEQDEYERRFKNAVYTAAGKGIRINPVICSGADLLTEYLMRQAAVLTGGTFVFVTDDSGIGDAHRDPEIPNAVVEKLNDLLVRLITGYHTGDFGLNNQ